jgi:hypothetical protein
MNLVIFTDNKTVKNAFSIIEKSRSNDLIYVSRKTLRKDIKNICKKDLIYIDISGYTEKEINSLIIFLSKTKNQSFGIIDPSGNVEDIAELFFKDITDYIGKSLLKEKIKISRIKKADEFRNAFREEETEKMKEDYIPSIDWPEIKPGKEYTFIFLYIGIDNTELLKQRFNTDILSKMQNNLRNYLEGFLKPYKGRMWIWNNFSGIMLFPFNGKKTDSLSAACRLHLNQKIISIECLNINAIVTFRLVMHIGNTIYKKRGSTGNIVSDTMNSIFHIGQKFIEPGNFNITEDVYTYLNNGLKDNFVPSGNFEGNEIYKFKI